MGGRWRRPRWQRGARRQGFLGTACSPNTQLQCQILIQKLCKAETKPIDRSLASSVKCGLGKIRTPRPFENPQSAADRRSHHLPLRRAAPSPMIPHQTHLPPPGPAATAASAQCCHPAHRPRRLQRPTDVLVHPAVWYVARNVSMSAAASARSGPLGHAVEQAVAHRLGLIPLRGGESPWETAAGSAPAPMP